MNNFKTWRVSIPVDRILSIICSTILPAVINYFGVLFFYKPVENDFDYIFSLTALVGSIVTLVLTVFLHNWLPRCAKFRPFGKYEGRWLQIIPDFDERPVSVFDFNFNSESKSYVLRGINFNTNNDSYVIFSAYKFIERDFHEGFYYITNFTLEHKNGLGKVGFLETDYDGLIRAEGYFFDAGNEASSKKYHTIMVKCDETFSEKIFGECNNYKDILNMSPKDIVEKSRSFVKQEIETHRNRSNEG